MPANHKVSVAWQIVFTFIPIVNFWAFYRIRKLTKYILFIILPTIAFIILVSFTSAIIKAIDESNNSGYDTYWGPTAGQFQPVLNLSIAIVASFVISIYLVAHWSSVHNKQFDQPKIG